MSTLYVYIPRRCVHLCAYTYIYLYVYNTKSFVSVLEDKTVKCRCMANNHSGGPHTVAKFHLRFIYLYAEFVSVAHGRV